GDHACCVPTCEALAVVEPVALSGLDGLIVEVTTYVVSKLFGRAVTVLRLLAQGFHHDGIDVTCQVATQALDARRAGTGDIGDRNVVGRDRVQHRSTRFLRVTQADRTFQLELTVRGRHLVWAQPTHELVEDHTQGVDITRGCDGATENLLGTCVLGRKKPVGYPRQIGQ